MRPLTRVRILGALAAGVAAATVLGTAMPAHAAVLPSNDWTEYQPANDYLPVSGPESCVPGTQFCVAITGDTADVHNDQYGLADLVSTDAGQTWTTYNGLFPQSRRCRTYPAPVPSSASASTEPS